jgi:hypothetical protein
MLVVLASSFDRLSIDLVKRWSSYDAVLMTCNDLSQPGWCYYASRPEESTVVIDGRKILAKEIIGVVTRLTHIEYQELILIRADDRS